VCASVRVLVCGRQNFKPRIHITDSDFKSFTENGKLCDERGQAREGGKEGGGEGNGGRQGRRVGGGGWEQQRERRGKLQGDQEM
jgi:hypothetical protein